MSTLANLETKFDFEYTKIDPNNKIRSSTEKASFINRGFFQIQKDGGRRRRENYAENTYTTTAGTRQYSLPSDFVKEEQMTYNGNVLVKTEKKNVRVINSTDSQGVPYYYYLYGSYVGFDPIPNSGYTIIMDYFKRLPTITTSVDCALPEDFDAAICAYACYLAMNSVEKQKAQIMLANYQLERDSLLSTYLYDDLNINFGISRGRSFTRSDVL